LEVDWLGQVKLLDDDAGPQVKVLVDDCNQLFIGPRGSAISIDLFQHEQGLHMGQSRVAYEDREWVGNTDGVRKLDQGTSGKASSNQGLGNPTGNVGSRAVDLGEVLSGESTTTMSTPATIGINDDLSAGQSCIALGATNDELARGLDL
jgi:hypothetical protein